jgi:hypothetical protein
MLERAGAPTPTIRAPCERSSSRRPRRACFEATTRLPSYQAAVLSWAPQIAQQDPAAMRNCQRRTRIGGRVNSRWFKLEAVRLIKERGVTVAQASRDLGEDLVSPSA